LYDVLDGASTPKVIIAWEKFMQEMVTMKNGK
jgi:hypothetical protein